MMMAPVQLTRLGRVILERLKIIHSADSQLVFMLKFEMHEAAGGSFQVIVFS